MMRIIFSKKGEPLPCHIVNKGTERASLMLGRWLMAMHDSIDSFYSRPSADKKESEWEIKKEMSAVGGCKYRITGGSSYLFSAAYQLEDAEGVTWIIYHTKEKRYAIKRWGEEI